MRQMADRPTRPTRRRKSMKYVLVYCDDADFRIEERIARDDAADTTCEAFVEYMRVMMIAQVDRGGCGRKDQDT